MRMLEKVQKMMNVLKILTQVGMIFCFIGLGTSLIGAIVLFAMPHIGNTEIMQMAMQEAGTENITQLAISLIAETVYLAAQSVMAVLTYRYFVNELKDGTPFTQRGAIELRQLGIRNIVIPLIGVIVAATIAAFGNAEGAFSNEAELSTGIAMILLALIFEYGAELEDKKKEIK